MQVNFLPQEQAESRKVLAVSGKLKLFASLFGFLCLAVGIGGSAFLYYKNTAIDELKKKETDLRAQVLAQEASEQTLVFVRDRLKRIQEIEQKNTNNADLVSQKELFETFPETVDIRQFDLAVTGSSLSVVVEDSETLGNLLELIKTKDFSTGSVDAISFNSQLGFQVKFSLK